MPSNQRMPCLFESLDALRRQTALLVKCTEPFDELGRLLALETAKFDRVINGVLDDALKHRREIDRVLHGIAASSPIGMGN